MLDQNQIEALFGAPLNSVTASTGNQKSYVLPALLLGLTIGAGLTFLILNNQDSCLKCQMKNRTTVY